MWSVRSCEGEDKGLVIGHVNSFVLNNVEFKVSEAGRQRVLRERRKNVHAGIVGKLEGYTGNKNSKRLLTYENPIRVSYNPYFGEKFYEVGSKNPVLNANMCIGIDSSVFTISNISWYKPDANI